MSTEFKFVVDNPPLQVFSGSNVEASEEEKEAMEASRQGAKIQTQLITPSAQTQTHLKPFQKQYKTSW